MFCYDADKFGIPCEQAIHITQYVNHLYRMEDVSYLFEKDEWFQKLSDAEKYTILDSLAEDVDDRLADVSNWYEVAEDVVFEWKRGNGYEEIER